MKIKLLIGNMHCKSCAVNIRDILKETDGILEAHVDLDSSSAIVEFDEKAIKAEEIIRKIQEAGYNAGMEA